MPAKINASTSSGLVVDSDLTGSLKLQTGGNDALSIDSSQVVNFTKQFQFGGVLPPAFSVHASSNQSVTTTVSTKILFQTELFDTNNNFASSRFTPTVAGYYQFNAYLSPNTVVTRTLVMLYKNGVRVNILLDGTSVPGTGGGGTILYLNGTTDYVEIYGRLDGTSPEYNSASDSTYFSGALIRAA